MCNKQRTGIAVFAVIVFAALVMLAGCGGDGAGTQDETGGGAGDATIVTKSDGSATISGVQVKDGTNVSWDYLNPTPVASLLNHNGTLNFNYMTNPSSDPYVELISYFLNGDSSIKVNNGKATIILGVPKPSSTYELFNGILPSGVTVTPSYVKILALEDDAPFLTVPTYDEGYFLCCMKDDLNFAQLVYADMDVKIKGTYTNGGITDIYDCSLKKGWNYSFVENSGEFSYTITASQTLPSGYFWVVDKY